MQPFYGKTRIGGMTELSLQKYVLNRAPLFGLTPLTISTPIKTVTGFNVNQEFATLRNIVVQRRKRTGTDLSRKFSSIAYKLGIVFDVDHVRNTPIANFEFNPGVGLAGTFTWDDYIIPGAVVTYRLIIVKIVGDERTVVSDEILDPGTAEFDYTFQAASEYEASIQAFWSNNLCSSPISKTTVSTS